MLTGFQVEVVAGLTEDGSLLCLDCASDEYTKPVIRYSLDEWEQRVAEGWNDLDENHVEDCECTYPVSCEGCGTELTEGYEDNHCKELREG